MSGSRVAFTPITGVQGPQEYTPLILVEFGHHLNHPPIRSSPSLTMPDPNIITEAMHFEAARKDNDSPFAVPVETRLPYRASIGACKPWVQPGDINNILRIDGERIIWESVSHTPRY